jgi:hypothetical protein
MKIIILVVLLIALYFLLRTPETFSQSGLNMSDRYCTRLVDTYRHPTVTDAEERLRYHNEVCGKSRRNTVTDTTGNYFTHYGMLV